MKINRHLETGNLMITDPCYSHQQNHFQCQDLPALMRVRFYQFVICKGGGFIRVVRTAVSDGLWIRLQDLINSLSLPASRLLLGPRPIISTCLRLRILFYLLLVSIILKCMLRKSNKNNVCCKCCWKI